MESELQSPPHSLIVAEREGSLMLKELTLDDAQVYFDTVDASREHLDKPYSLISQYLPTIQSVRNNILHASLTHYKFGVWEADKFRGSAELVTQSNQEAEIGCWIGADHVGKNFATRSTQLLTHWAFRELDIESVVAKIHKENVVSKRVIYKSGFFFARSTGEWDVFTRERSMDAALPENVRSPLAS